MAKAAFNKELLSSGESGGPTIYTVPTGKYAIFAMWPLTTTQFKINGINACSLNLTGAQKPFAANAGDVLSVTGASANISGFLYDV